jgi:hypothetical protein
MSSPASAVVPVPVAELVGHMTERCGDREPVALAEPCERQVHGAADGGSGYHGHGPGGGVQHTERAALQKRVPCPAQDGQIRSAPIWAALIALADQYAGRRLGFINPAIYQIARSARYHQALHDITTGNNTVQFPPTTITGYQAGPGWDPVTGWGSPNAQVLIPLLARYASP